MPEASHDDELIKAAEAAAAAHAVAADRIAHRRRRLQASLIDLGLDQVLGADWCQIGDDGFEFLALDARTSDRLVVVLEDLARRWPPAPTPQASGTQGQFDI